MTTSTSTHRFTTNHTEQRRVTLSRETWDLLESYAAHYDIRLGAALDRLITAYEPWIQKELGSR
jgi:uncharacterized protein with von Willebrand factor type A (vWA) domain